jgi:hypothetical protein
VTERTRRILGVVSATAYLGFCATLLLDGPGWLLVVLFIAGTPAGFGVLAPRRRDPLLDDDMRIPAWLEYAPFGRLAVAALAGASVAGLCAAFGADWWSLAAGVAVGVVVWIAVREPLPDPFDRPARGDR